MSSPVSLSQVICLTRWHFSSDGLNVARTVLKSKRNAYFFPPQENFINHYKTVRKFISSVLNLHSLPSPNPR